MIRSVSYGGGVQSTALLVLAAQGRIDFPLFLFANVGDDSEHPATLRYVREVAAPYAAENGIELVELRRKMRDGTTETLVGRMDRRVKSVPIPVRMGKNGAPGNRTCTLDFKIKVIAKELKRRGATAETPATVAIGFSTDEIQRVKPSRDDIEVFVHPLLDLGMNRGDAIRMISDAGLPVPPRSSCFFCPFHTLDEWRNIRRRTPELFDRSVEIERQMHDRGLALGRGQFYLTRHGRFLDEVVADQGVLFDDDGDDTCEVGHCFT